MTTADRPTQLTELAHKFMLARQREKRERRRANEAVMAAAREGFGQSAISRAFGITHQAVQQRLRREVNR